MIYSELTTKYSKLFGIDERLIRAIIQTESSFNPWAIRVERGFWTRYLGGIKATFFKTPEKDEKWLTYPDLVSASYGLMQIMLTTAMEMGFRFKYPTELLEPETNIKYGCAYLKKLYNRYGDWKDAVAAYNAGVAKKNLDRTYKNQNYVDKVTKYFSEER